LAFFDLRRNGDVSARFTHSSIGEGPEYRPFRDLRSVPEAGRHRKPVQIHGRGCTQVLFLRKAELGFFHFLEIVSGWLVPSAQVRELKIQRKNPGSALQVGNALEKG
jgi:hypothetical protein